MGITNFDRSTVKQIRELLESTLSEKLGELGLSADIGSIRFGDSDFSCKLSVGLGSKDDAAQREWDKNAFKFGLKSEDFGKTFGYNNDLYEIVGIKPKSRKYPILGKDSAGKTYKFPVSALGIASTF